MSFVLMTTDTVGGVWTYSIELIRSLREQEFDFVLATLGRPMTRDQRRQVASIPGLEVRESSYRLEWMEDPWRDVDDAGHWLLGLEKEFSPQLIHLNSFSFGSLAWRAPRILVGHGDALSWIHAVRKQAPGNEWARYHERVCAGLNGANLVVTPSQASAADLREHYGPVPEIRVIPNGRDIYSPGSSAGRQKEPLILSVGRVWDEAKNMTALDAVAADLEWKICVAGSVSDPCARKGMTQELSHLEMLGELSQESLMSWYSRASIYALPARYEPFGLSVLEAATAGCALVLGNIPSLRENWQNAAIFVDPEDPTSLREVLRFLMEDQEARERYGAQARERARFFSSRRMASSYAQEYRRLAKPIPPLTQQQLAEGGR